MQTSPPPGVNILKRASLYKCDNLAALRSIRTEKANEKYVAILLGENEKYDGLLQGWYDYVPAPDHLSRADNGGDWIIVEDGGSAWFKFA